MKPKFLELYAPALRSRIAFGSIAPANRAGDQNAAKTLAWFVLAVIKAMGNPL
jgi:hypothetical protein